MFPSTHATRAVLLLALTFTLASCEKQEKQANPPASSSSGMTMADCETLSDLKPSNKEKPNVSPRDACRATVSQAEKSNADLARIREIKEGEVADRKSSNESEEEWKRKTREGSQQPIKTYKY